MGLITSERRMAMTDHELRALMNSSLNEGAKALYKQYAQYIYAIIFRILRDCGTREDVEDCFAEVFAEIVQHYSNIQGESLKAYIGQAARNKALDHAHHLFRKYSYTASPKSSRLFSRNSFAICLTLLPLA